MAAVVAFALALVLAEGALATHDTVPEPCGREQLCPSTGASPCDQGAQDAQGPGWKCSLCVKILERTKKVVGDEPDEDAVRAALAKVCRGTGKLLGRVCKRVLKKYSEQIAEALAGGDEPRAACAAMRFCKG
ncbi:granulysin [Eudromia elegans]